MFKKINLFIVFVFLFSCMRTEYASKQNLNSVNNNTADNRAEISDLNNKIEKLEQKIRENRKQQLNSDDKFASKLELNEIELELKRLRSELFDLLEQQESRLNDKLDVFLADYNRFKKQLDSNLNSYVRNESFELSMKRIEKTYVQKEEILRMRFEHSNSEAVSNQYQSELSTLREEFEQYRAEQSEMMQKALDAWELRLEKKLTENNNQLNAEIKKYITQEIVRLKTSIENIEAEVQSAEKENDKEAVKQLEALLAKSKEQLKNIDNRIEKISGSTLSDEIMKNIFSPCTSRGSLKDDPYCYTLGTMIHKLGGQFIDPKSFKRTHKDLMSYFSLSGIKSNEIITKSWSYLVPSSQANKALLKECHKDEKLEKLIPPPALWPRGIILSLLLQKIESDLQVRKDLKMIDDKISPITGVISWWRSECYQKGIGSGSISDHNSGAAFDLSFSNHESFDFYRDFIAQHIWNDDAFGIRYPLESAKLSFSIGLGLGHGHGNGKMHFGIASPVSRFGIGQKRSWSYGDYQNPLK